MYHGLSVWRGNKKTWCVSVGKCKQQQKKKEIIFFFFLKKKKRERSLLQGII